MTDVARDKAFSDAMKGEYSCWLKDNPTDQDKETDGHH